MNKTNLDYIENYYLVLFDGVIGKVNQDSPLVILFVSISTGSFYL